MSVESRQRQVVELLEVLLNKPAKQHQMNDPWQQQQQQQPTVNSAGD